MERHFNKLVVVGMVALLFNMMGCDSGKGKTESMRREKTSQNISAVDRDGNTYKIVKIGTQTWMAENLKVRTEGSWCYENKESNCQKYGRLYNWEAAKIACPAGWHLPSRGEFETLLKAVGGTQDKNKEYKWRGAGVSLKSTTGWDKYKGKSGNGEDAFGFSALPAGYEYDNGDYTDEGYSASFRSSTEDGSGYVYCMNLAYVGGSAFLRSSYRSHGFSVRCLKD